MMHGGARSKAACLECNLIGQGHPCRQQLRGGNGGGGGGDAPRWRTSATLLS